MKNKIILFLALIIVIVILIIGLRKKEDNKSNNLSQFTHYNVKFDDYEEYENLSLLCYSEDNENVCDLFDKTISNTQPIENIKSKENEYLPNYIHFGNFNYEEKHSFSVNDNLADNIDFINDFYALYTKNENKYERVIKVHGKEAQKYKETSEYIIYKEENNSNYFLIPLNNPTHFSSFVINDNNAVSIYVREDKKYVYPKLIIYNYKTGEIVKEYNFDKLKNIYSFEDSPIGFNEEEKLFILNEKNYYLNLDNFKELTLKHAIFYYDEYIIDDNKVYDYKLNLIKEFNSDETAIYIPTINDIYETAYILYEKGNIIYNLENKVIYNLEDNEKYYASEDILIIYNDKYITKVINHNGKIIVDNKDNIYNLNVPKNNDFNSINIDINGNLITYNNEVNTVKCFRNNKEINYSFQIKDMYVEESIKDNNVKINLYDNDLNIINTFDFNNDEKIYRVDYSLLKNKMMQIVLNVGSEENHEYCIIYLYDFINKKLFDEVIYTQYGLNFIELSDSIVALGGNKNNKSEFLYYINDKIYKINNDLNVKSIYSYNDNEIVFEENENNYIVVPINQFKNIFN